MKRKGLLKKVFGTALSISVMCGAVLLGQDAAVHAAGTARTVTAGSAAVSTEGYTKKEDGSGIKWDSVNGQYLYVGGIKYHLLERSGDRVLLRSAGYVSDAYAKKELEDADVWNKLNTIEQQMVMTVDLPKEEYTWNGKTFKAKALSGAKIYQLNLNDVFRYYEKLSDNYVGSTRSNCKVD